MCDRVQTEDGICPIKIDLYNPSFAPWNLIDALLFIGEGSRDWDAFDAEVLKYVDKMNHERTMRAAKAEQDVADRARAVKV